MVSDTGMRPTAPLNEQSSIWSNITSPCYDQNRNNTCVHQHVCGSTERTRVTHVVKDEKEKEKHLDARFGTKTGMFFEKIKAQINLREYIFGHLNVYEVLIFCVLCLLNNLDFVGHSHAAQGRYIPK